MIMTQRKANPLLSLDAHRSEEMPIFSTVSIGDDVLKGAESIACFIYGCADDRRKIYHLAQTGKIPVFRMGNTICARKSTILRWIAEQESKASGGTAGMS